VLCAVGGKEQKLCERVNFHLRVKQDIAYALTERRAAGFARRDDLVPAHPQFAGKEAHLRGFPAPVNAFKSDKSAAQ
jgi:hypothetical protein